MVRTRLPEGIVALHTFKTNQDILHRIVKRMAHVKLSRDIGRRNDNRKRSLRLVHFRMEILLIQPFLI